MYAHVLGGAMDVCTHVGVRHIKGLYSQTPLLSPSCQSLSAAVHVPGGSGGALTPALCGWRGHQSGQDPENPLTRIQHLVTHVTQL